MIKVSDLKKDFPIFDRKINGKRLTYLDSGATSQKPNSVISEMTCLLYTSPSPRDLSTSRMPSSA